ncbi:MAG: transglutaminase-like domain-containing protein [Acidobacteriota bacterium]
MRSRRITATLVTAIALAWLTTAPTARTSEEYYYGIEIGGRLCGYARVTAVPLRKDGHELIQLTHESVIRATLLGGPVDVRMTLTYRVDPEMKGFTEHASVIEQGPNRMASALRIEGSRALVAGQKPGEEDAVDLPPDVVLANTLRFPHLVADFVGTDTADKTYHVFDGRDNAVRDVTYTRKGSETLTLAGRSFKTVMFDSLDRRTGVAATVWIDEETGVVVQTRHPGQRLTYLAGPDIVDAVTDPVRMPDLSGTIMTPTNVTIRNVRDISYMKVRASMRPSGLLLTPDALNVPGQRFEGAVKDNAVEGVFEIGHRRYDGSQAPPFPPDFSHDPGLREYLASSELIQSDDPVLIAKAREITNGSPDAWEAARRLSAGVGNNIKGAIPGGGSARGTFDQRAGECGGHSFLMAAFARAVGIPARAVWGAMYTPRNGGEFGQHAWNEVYMGAAGWIPVDTTITETDYVDSGHIRVGVFQSLATVLNARSFEILEHRTER